MNVLVYGMNNRFSEFGMLIIARLCMKINIYLKRYLQNSGIS